MAIETTQEIDINLLHPHPRNVEIYGDEDVTELQQSIRESGWIKPLTVNPEYVVISGHRRYQAAKALGYTQIPVVIEAFASPEAEMERLLRENENRGKTPEQQIREGMTWEPIENVRAEKREKLGNTRNPTRKCVEGKGEAVDIIARRVGLGSGDTYKKGREVVQYMDSMLGIGSERGSIIRMNLNDESINAAHKAMKKYQQLDKEARERRERQEAARLKGQMTKLHTVVDQVLDLADELAKGTIEKVMGKSDAELGLEFLLRGMMQGE